MTSQELREKFLDYFKKKEHAIIPSASLLPENDPTVLFTTAGMHPLVPYLLGEKHPAGKRLADVQKCMRTGDIDAVGDAWHLTFFEMLGNWSLGDYFKEEAIAMAWEFLTSKKWLGIDPKRLSVSVFAGDKDAPRDTEAAQIWEKQGLPREQIYYYPKSENWWGPAGETGPCGPDTEIFFDTLKSPWKKPHQCEPKCACGRYAEIWNLVFMEYDKKIKDKKEKGKNAEQYEYISLQQKNIDTGMGLERTCAVLNGKDNVYETDLLAPIIQKVKDLIPDQKNDFSEKEIQSIRIIAEHMRAITFMVADGVRPTKVDQGYVLRRLIRRAIRQARILDIPNEISFGQEISMVVVDLMKDFYPELGKDVIIRPIQEEEKKFKALLRRMYPRVNKRIAILERIKRGEKRKGDAKWIKSDSKASNNESVFRQWFDTKADKEEYRSLAVPIAAIFSFALESTYGYPFDFFKEDLENAGFFNEGWQEEVTKVFKSLFCKHQTISAKGAIKRFKGGLADASEKTIKYHTATHLLHQALRQILGEHVAQRGSNITEERLRFDFSHSEKLTPEELSEVEQIVNSRIQEGLPVKMEEMSVDEAKKSGAIGLFEHKYGNKVKVYSIGTFSKEICGGPHVKNTKELGKLKIIKEEGSSAGVRRIKAKLI